jgi:LAS superfamily LD-carboxypeptidase LdcB
MRFFVKVFRIFIFIAVFGAVSFVVVAYVSNLLGLMSADEFKNYVFKKVKVQEETFEIADTRELVVSFKQEPLEIYEAQTAITIQTNKPVVLNSNNRQSLFFIKNKDGVNYYVLRFDNIGIGESKLKFTLTDEAYLNIPEKLDIEIPDFAVQEFSISVTRIPGSLPYGMDSIEDWEGYVYVVAEADGLLTRVDKGHKLVDNYDPGELVNVSSDLLLYANTPDIVVRKDAGDALRRMLLDAQAQTGKTLTVLSGYRSYNEQVKIYSGNVSKYGEEEADKISARPGYSEHQLGTTVDFYSPDTGSEIFSQGFLETTIGKWLEENAYKYGFVMTLGPEQNQYQFEPWHWRYIGVENAKLYRASDLEFGDWLVSMTNT